MPILMKKVLKLWCENIQEGGLQLFQGLRLFPSLEIVDKPKLKELGGDQKLVDISVIAIKKLSQGPKEVIFVGTKKRYVCNTNFSSNQDQKKKLFLMSSQASSFFYFLLSYYPAERIGLFLPSNSTLFLQCLLLRSLVLFMFSVVIQFKKERNLFCK